MIIEQLPRTIGQDPALWSDFIELCAFGGRLAGSSGEAAARDWAADHLRDIEKGQVSRLSTPYTGWTCTMADLRLMPAGEPLDATALLCCAETPPGGLELEVVDCGRGTPDDIRAVGSRLQGTVALVRHDYMFGTTTVHRRVKLRTAIEAGAAAFLIAAPERGMGPVSGSSGLVEAARSIPALGISAEAAERLRAPGSRVHIEIAARFLPEARTETLLLDMAGAGPERVVLSAHIDGHAAGESALDNASGVALALSLARQAGPYIAGCRRGLLLALFSAEEWALTGSKEWLGGLAEEERLRLVFNLNLDTVIGGSGLTALTSGFPRLGNFVSEAVSSVGVAIGVHEPLMPNSDHANFAAWGIPALRLVSGFDEPDSRCRLVLTEHDRADLTSREEFDQPWRVAWSILRAALAAAPAALASLSERSA